MSINIALDKAAAAREALQCGNAGVYRDAVKSALLDPTSALADWITEFKFGKLSADEAMQAIVATIEFEAGSRPFVQYIRDSRLSASPDAITWDYRLKERLL